MVFGLDLSDFLGDHSAAVRFPQEVLRGIFELFDLGLQRFSVGAMIVGDFLALPSCPLSASYCSCRSSQSASRASWACTTRTVSTVSRWHWARAVLNRVWFRESFLATSVDSAKCFPQSGQNAARRSIRHSPSCHERRKAIQQSQPRVRSLHSPISGFELSPRPA